MRLHFTSDTTSLELGYDPLTPVDPDNKEMSPHSFDVTLRGEIIANGLATEQGLTRIEGFAKAVRISNTEPRFVRDRLRGKGNTKELRFSDCTSPLNHLCRDRNMVRVLWFG